MPFQLTGKRVFVTGSSRGIGYAIAQEFAKNGCLVFLNAFHDKNLLEISCKHLQKAGYSCHACWGDASDYTSVLSVISQIEQEHGPIDILVNNAGISHIGLFSDMTPADWQNIINTNVFSVFNCTKAVLPAMIHQKAGVILNISSIWGNDGASCEAVYSASKGAVNSFTKALAKELGPSGIRVNAIACGVIDTEMNSFLSEEEKKALADSTALGRFGTVEEIASLAVFIASPNASYLTGQIITIDGCML